MVLRVLLLMLSGGWTWAQLTLNPGDVWTHSFTSIPFYSTEGGSSSFHGFFEIHIVPGTLTSNAVLRSEMFEDALATIPKNYKLISMEPTNGYWIVVSTPFAWQDHEGAVRLKMLHGSCRVDDVAFVAKYSADMFATNFTPQPLAPRLEVKSFSTGPRVSWWTNGADGYVLESTNVLGATTWPVSSEVPAVVDGRYVVTITFGTQQYFRLRK